MNLAVLHEAAFEYGGGMRVIDTLGEELDADIIIGFATEDVVRKSTNDLQILWKKEMQGRSRAIESMVKFPLVSLHEYDVVIESGSGTHWYLPHRGQKIVRYVHSVPLSYKQNTLFDRLSRILRKPTIKIADRYVANSEQTSQEVRDYLGEDSEIIYPPTDTSKFHPKVGTGFVTISRLTERKRVGELVDTFNSREETLTVVGSGPLLGELREKANENVHIMGWVSEENKANILRKGGVFILNSGNESFGISPVEAMASGMPIIARNGGYTPNQVDDGFNGILFDSLEDGIERFLSEGVSASMEDIVNESKKYSHKSFASDFRRIVDEVA
jgi:glycosyltransferase involved in cell wall biosynthesis